MTISPFTPLFFYTNSKRPKGDWAESPYWQTFARTDRILVEFICSQGEYVPVLALTNLDINRNENLVLSSWEMNGATLYFADITGLTEGMYKIYIPNYELQSYEFRVTADAAELGGTTLIQYSMQDNKRRLDGVFLIAGMRRFFDFRVPGGFKESETTFGCESDQFVTQAGDIRTLYAIETTQRKFTMGSGEGVPARFGELLNRLLCCTYVYFDGVRYTRKDSSVPEMSIQMEGVDSFVFKQSLQKVVHLNPTIENANQVLLRRTSSGYRTTDYNDTNRQV